MATVVDPCLIVPEVDLDEGGVRLQRLRDELGSGVPKEIPREAQRSDGGVGV